MNFWKVIFATAVIFCAGVMTGGLLVNYVDHSHRGGRRAPANGEPHPSPEVRDTQSRSNSLPRPRPPEILSTNFVQHLDDALQLAPDQREVIEKIIADGQERNHAIWTNNAAQMRAVIQDVRHGVREALTADQQKQFDELVKRPFKKNLFPTNAPAVSISTNAP